MENIETQERRTATRRKVFWGGILVLDGLGPIIHCSIRNVSETGALIDYPKQQVLPSECWLIIDDQYVAYKSRVVRRAAGRCGLHFIENAVLSESAGRPIAITNFRNKLVAIEREGKPKKASILV